MAKKSEKDIIIQAITESLVSPVIKVTPKEDSIVLTGKSGGATKIDYKDIKLSSWNIKHELSSWTNRDFAIFMREKYIHRYYKDWGINIVGVVPYLDRIKDAIVVVTGFCDNIVFHDYIEFYFDRWCDYFLTTHEFSVHSMKFDAPVKDFAEKYDYKSSLMKYMQQSCLKETHKKHTLSGENIENAYLLGEEAFLLSCGLILSVNWLICEKQIDAEDAIRYVVDILKRSQNNLKAIIDTTCKYSPYPKWFPFQDVKNILSQTDYEVMDDWSTKIEYSKNSKYSF